MGLGGISIWQLLIVLVIVILLFGTKKLKGLGTDLGGAIKGFKNAVTDENSADKDSTAKDSAAKEATNDKAEEEADIASATKAESSTKTD